MTTLSPSAIFSAAIAVSDLLDSSSGADTVGIFDATTFEQLFSAGRPLAADVRETSTIMSYPTETGTVLSDHHIINPSEIIIPLFVTSANYNAVYGQIRQAFIAATKLSVQTRTGVYNNMVIADIPHREDAEMFNAIVVNVRFKEIIYVVPASVSGTPAPANYVPLAPEDQDTVLIGQKYAVPISIAGGVGISALLKRI